MANKNKRSIPKGMTPKEMGRYKRGKKQLAGVQVPQPKPKKK